MAEEIFNGPDYDELWAVPVGVTSVTIEAWGSGGIGGSSNAGGGGGAYGKGIWTVNDTHLHITIPSEDNSIVYNSDDSLQFVVARAGNSSADGVGGTATVHASLASAVTHNGGDGGSGGLEDEGGGGGGGGAGTTEVGFSGNNAVGGTGGSGGLGGSADGGDGGAGGDLGQNGVSGTAPGGGGGGKGFGGASSGAAAAGRVRLTYEVTGSPACSIFDIDLRIFGTITVR
jgi:hypothetical protein